MSNILDFFVKNSTWIKDLFGLIFAGTATVVTILAYRRAKATVLQPKRTEVVKIQTQALIDFLKSFSENGNTIDSSLDYINTFRCNFMLALWKSNILDLENGSEFYDDLNKNIGGWYIFTDNNPSGLAQVKGNLDDYFFVVNSAALVSKPAIVLSKQSLKFINQVREMSNNPFIPDEVLKIIDQIIQNLYYNFFELMPTMYQNPEQIVIAESLRITEFFDSFEKKRKHHINDDKILREKIRAYLGIDDKW